MSDQGSDVEDGVMKALPTDMFLMAGNPNPVGMPFFRQGRPGEGDAEDRLSLVGSLDMSDEWVRKEGLMTGDDMLNINIGAILNIKVGALFIRMDCNWALCCIF